MYQPATKVSLFEGQGLLEQASWQQQRYRYLFAIAGRGWGKTWYGARWLYNRIKERSYYWEVGYGWKPSSFIVMSPKHSMLLTTTVPMLRSYFDEIGLQYSFVASPVPMFRLATGGLIVCGSAEVPESVEGVHATAAWFDEAGQATSSTPYTTLQGRIGLRGGKLLVTTTPYSDAPEGWLQAAYDRWAIDKDPLYFMVQGRSDDNPYYDLTAMRQAEIELPYWQYAMMYLGMMGMSRPGLVWPEYQGCFIDEAPEGWQDWDLYEGYDDGTANPTAYLLAALSPEDGTLYVVHEHYRRDALIEDHAAAIKWLRPPGNTPTGSVMDPSAKRVRKELWEKHGLWFAAADNDVSVGIRAVGARMRTGRLKIVRGNCKNLVRELGLYRRKPVPGSDDKFLDEVVKENDHAPDALRYLIMRVDNAVAPRMRII